MYILEGQKDISTSEPRFVWGCKHDLKVFGAGFVVAALVTLIAVIIKYGAR
jgi:hypothetical protein